MLGKIIQVNSAARTEVAPQQPWKHRFWGPAAPGVGFFFPWHVDEPFLSWMHAFICFLADFHCAPIDGIWQPCNALSNVHWKNKEFLEIQGVINVQNSIVGSQFFYGSYHINTWRNSLELCWNGNPWWKSDNRHEIEMCSTSTSEHPWNWHSRKARCCCWSLRLLLQCADSLGKEVAVQWEGLVVCWNCSCLPLSNMDQRIYEVASHIHLGTALSTKTKQDLIALLKKPLVHIC